MTSLQQNRSITLGRLIDAKLKGLCCIHKSSEEIVGLVHEIVQPHMSSYEKLWSIFSWVVENINYGHLKLFRHPYPRTDLEVLEDREGTCSELTIFLLSLASSAGLKLKWAKVTKDVFGVKTNHMCAVLELDDGCVRCIDPTPFYSHFGLGLMHKEFKVYHPWRINEFFRRWTKWIVQDAIYVGLPLAQLLNIGSILEKVIDEDRNKRRLIYVSIIPEHGEKGGKTCDASLIKMHVRIYEVSLNEYWAYDRTPIELTIEYKISPTNIIPKYLFYLWRDEIKKQQLIFETTSLSDIPTHIYKKFVDIFSILNELNPFVGSVLKEAQRVNTIRQNNSQVSSVNHILEKVLR